MYNRLLKMARLLPALAIAPILYHQAPIRLDSSIDTPLNIDKLNLFTNSKIRYVDDLALFMTQVCPNTVYIIYEVKEDNQINQQVVEIINQFISNNAISENYQFVFLKSDINIDPESFFLVLSERGEKIINLQPYINQTKSKGVKKDIQKVIQRLTQTINIYPEINISNLSKHLQKMRKQTQNVGIISFAQSNNKESIKKAKQKLGKFCKDYQLSNKSTDKYIITDHPSQTVLGLSQQDKKQEQVYLIVPANKNLRKQIKQKEEIISINGKKYTIIDPLKHSPQSLFIFPPIMTKKNPDQLILNIYLNKNKIPSKLYNYLLQQFEKQEFKDISKQLNFSNDVEQMRITLQAASFLDLSLKAYKQDTNLNHQQINKILTNSYEWEYPHNELNTKLFTEWIETVRNKGVQEKQFFKSQDSQKYYAQQIVGSDYKDTISKPYNKIIYHYSKHCHGCKKFGGKYQQFAKDQPQKHPATRFYRINNDNNKSQGVRNFDSTPIFVFYKKGYNCPFIYRMPYFTQRLFEDFLKINESIQVIDRPQFENHISEHLKNKHFVQQML